MWGAVRVHVPIVLLPAPRGSDICVRRRAREQTHLPQAHIPARSYV